MDIKKFIDAYKKNPVGYTFILLLLLAGLYFAWYITITLVIAILLWKKFNKDEAKNKGTKVKCPHCKTEIEWDASRCPHCHGKINIWTTDKKKVALVLSVLIFVIFSGAISSGNFLGENSSTSSTQEQAISNRKLESTVYAKEVIKGILKSPSTAQFTDVSAYELSNLKDVWAVNGYVDSQNSFGAMIRNQWEVQLDYRDGKGGTVKSILFDGKKMQ